MQNGRSIVSNTVRTAVFPVAGRGTRFLPVTKSSPKEMLPVVDKPLIQYAVEEALAAGAERLIFVTGSSKRAIEDHFDRDHELEAALRDQDKPELLQSIRDIVPDSATCIYVRQSAPLGLGHAVLCARDVVGDEPFYVHLADDLIDAEIPCLVQMNEAFLSCEGSVIGVQPVPADKTDQYGIVEVEDASEKTTRIKRIVEKPAPEKAPSNLGVVGRYLLTPAVFKQLATTGRGAGGEIQLTDGIAGLMAEEPVYAYRYDGKRYDCGSKLGYLQATVEYALKHAELGPR
ncbi:MAG: UTP--glucose-1-phosphate uridylyltransferase GalU, partial [Gammaproteobacteria bacterium]|nr:UTP--glucose-1-phosphate uridylyltransferase GalU [Gammaproteobacteria bacterium]MCZ6911287.1 UTP--glucose-1-phosphate uridylyltransferase GalU [Pseudomonadota bacterium]